MPTRADLNTSNPQGNSNISTGIDVSVAEHEFQEMSRQMTGPVMSRVSTRRSHHGDPEKGGVETESDEVFNLEDHLRGNESSERDAGIKQKRIGMLSCEFVYDGCCYSL